MTIVPAAARAPRVARPAPRRLHRPRPRLDDRRRAAVRVHPQRLRQAARRLGLRAARHPPGDPDDPAPRSREGRAEVENQYSRVVPYDGNAAALQVMAEVFEVRPHFEWRGLGFISQSGLRLSDAYADFDAELRYETPGVRVADPEGVSVRRGAEGRDQAVGVQGLRHRLHPRAARSAPAWSRRRGPARPTTSTAASPASGRSSDARRRTSPLPGSPTASGRSSTSSRRRRAKRPRFKADQVDDGPRRRRQGDPDD